MAIYGHISSCWLQNLFLGKYVRCWAWPEPVRIFQRFVGVSLKSTQQLLQFSSWKFLKSKGQVHLPHVAVQLDSCFRWSALGGCTSNIILESSDNNWSAWTSAIFFFSSLQFLFEIHTIQRQPAVLLLFNNLPCTNAFITETMDSKIRLIISWQEMQGGEHWYCVSSNSTGENGELTQQQDSDVAEGRSNMTPVLLLGPHSVQTTSPRYQWGLTQLYWATHTHANQREGLPAVNRGDNVWYMGQQCYRQSQCGQQFHVVITSCFATGRIHSLKKGSSNARANHPVNTFLNECLYT